ncbi:hypothetical protein ACSQ5K_15190 [Pseudomonas sp. PhalM4]
MLRSLLFQVEADVEVSSSGVSHATISCLQWRSPNLALLEVAAKQTLALMWYGTLDDEVLGVLEKAHLHGALAPVSMIKVRAYKLHLFLADEVSSKSMPAIEALWEKVKDAANVQFWAVHFSHVSEIVADQSDDDFCTTAKEILWLHDLGLVDFDGSAEGNQLLGYRVPAMADVNGRYLPQRVLPDLEKAIRKSHDQVAEAAEALCLDDDESRTLPDEGEQADYVMPVSPQARCMLELMAAGIRPHELRNIQLGINFALHPDTGLKVEVSKTRLPVAVKMPLRRESVERLQAYIEASGLVDGNYLFPSTRDPNKRMKDSEFVAVRQLQHLAEASDQAKIDHFVSMLEFTKPGG